MQWFRINISGLGNVWVQAGSSADAIRRAKGVANARGVKLGETDISSLTAIPAAEPTGSGIVVDDRGNVTQIGQQPVGTQPTPTGTTPSSPPGSAQPGPTTPENQIPPTITIPEDEWVERELAAPDAAFRTFLQQRGMPTRGVVGDIIGSFSGAGQNLYSLQEPLNAIRGQNEEDSLMDFYNRSIQPGTGVIRGLGRAGLGALRGLASAGSDAPAQADPFMQPGWGSNEGEALRGAIRSALTGRNAFFGSRFGSSVDDALRKRYEDSIYQGNQAPNFAQWALENLNINPTAGATRSF